MAKAMKPPTTPEEALQMTLTTFKMSPVDGICIASVCCHCKLHASQNIANIHTQSPADIQTGTIFWKKKSSEVVWLF